MEASALRVAARSIGLPLLAAFSSALALGACCLAAVELAPYRSGEEVAVASPVAQNRRGDWAQLLWASESGGGNHNQAILFVVPSPGRARWRPVVDRTEPSPRARGVETLNLELEAAPVLDLFGERDAIGAVVPESLLREFATRGLDFTIAGDPHPLRIFLMPQLLQTFLAEVDSQRSAQTDSPRRGPVSAQRF